MGVLIDLTGRRVGKLTVMRRDGFEVTGSAGGKQPYWSCRCDCGRWTRVAGFNLRANHTLSCGCLIGEVMPHHARRPRKDTPRTRGDNLQKGLRRQWLISQL